MIRFTSIELDRFKNVAHGKIALSSWPRGEERGSDIIGIYGQNGSGKTSVVKAFAIAKSLMIGEKLPQDAVECIASGSSTLGLLLEGLVLEDAHAMGRKFSYAVEVGLSDDRPVVVAERLRAAEDEGPGASTKVLFDYRREADVPRSFEVRPKGAWEALTSLSRDVLASFMVAQRISFDAQTSFLFSRQLGETLDEVRMFASNASTKLGKVAAAALTDVVPLLSSLRNSLCHFALCDLAVLGPWQQAEPMLDLLRIAAHEDESGRLNDKRFYVDLTKPTTLSPRELHRLEVLIGNVSLVVGSLVPGLSLGVEHLGAGLLDEGGRGERIEITATRDGVKVPLRCESEGIKKLVGILNLLIDVYGRPGACVVVDELDSGIFEFLLGEILAVLQQKGKGQLVFTAHNLRPLETLDKGSLVFTTTNPEHRYTTFKGVKASNNLRSLYLRAIDLGGQPEVIYESTSPYEIDSAFYEAGITSVEDR